MLIWKPVSVLEDEHGFPPENLLDIVTLPLERRWPASSSTSTTCNKHNPLKRNRGPDPKAPRRMRRPIASFDGSQENSKANFPRRIKSAGSWKVSAEDHSLLTGHRHVPSEQGNRRRAARRGSSPVQRIGCEESPCHPHGLIPMLNRLIRSVHRAKIMVQAMVNRTCER